jgi:hypothetical protein
MQENYEEVWWIKSTKAICVSSSEKIFYSFFIWQNLLALRHSLLHFEGYNEDEKLHKNEKWEKWGEISSNYLAKKIHTRSTSNNNLKMLLTFQFIFIITKKHSRFFRSKFNTIILINLYSDIFQTWPKFASLFYLFPCRAWNANLLP